MTETDKAFEKDRPGYYIFSDKQFERTCMTCGKKFSTTLSMNRFCKPSCKREALGKA